MTGADLSWFWRSWWYTTDKLDLAITNVETRGEGAARTVSLELTRTTGVLFPPAVRVQYEDGTTEDFRFPVDVWTRGASVSLAAPARGKVVGARLWPDGTVPDWNAANDTWGTPPKVDSQRPVTK